MLHRIWDQSESRHAISIHLDGWLFGFLMNPSVFTAIASNRLIIYDSKNDVSNPKSIMSQNHPSSSHAVFNWERYRVPRWSFVQIHKTQHVAKRRKKALFRCPRRIYLSPTTSLLRRHLFHVQVTPRQGQLFTVALKRTPMAQAMWGNHHQPHLRRNTTRPPPHTHTSNKDRRCRVLAWFLFLMGSLERKIALEAIYLR